MGRARVEKTKDEDGRSEKMRYEENNVCTIIFLYICRKNVKMFSLFIADQAKSSFIN